MELKFLIPPPPPNGEEENELKLPPTIGPNGENPTEIIMMMMFQYTNSCTLITVWDTPIETCQTFLCPCLLVPLFIDHILKTK